MRQLTIFDITTENNDYEKIYEELEHYGVDNKYISDFEDKNALFTTIENTLSKISNYEEYILKLFDILKNYILTVNDARDSQCLNNNETVASLNYWSDGKPYITICLEENGLYLRSVGPYFCLSMIPKRVFEREAYKVE